LQTNSSIYLQLKYFTQQQPPLTKQIQSNYHLDFIIAKIKKYIIQERNTVCQELVDYSGATITRLQKAAFPTAAGNICTSLLAPFQQLE